MDNEHENEDELDLKDKIEGDPPDDNADPSTPEEIAKARRLGWFPEAEWDAARAEKAGRHKPERFKWAREYIADTEDDRTFLRERLQKQDRQITELNGKLTDVHEIVVSQRRMTAEAVKRARADGIAEAEQRMRDAVESGEMKDYDTAKADRDKLAKTALPEEPESKQQEQREDERPRNPEAERWVSANPWFNDDDVLMRAMISEEVLMKKKHPGVELYQVLEKAKDKVKERYPERFNLNPRRDAPGTVSQPSGARQGRTGFDAIPQADKDAYEQQRRMFAGMKGRDGKPIVYSKEEFMQEYAH
jgi:hypothetical protein